MGFRGGPAGGSCGEVPGPVVEQPQIQTPPCHLGPGQFLTSLTPSHGSLPITPRKPSLTELAQPQKVATDVTVVLSHRVLDHSVLSHRVLLSCAGAGGHQTLDPNPENVRGGQALQEVPWPCSSHSWGDEAWRQQEARADPVPMSLSAGGSESSASWRGCLRPSCPPHQQAIHWGRRDSQTTPSPFSEMQTHSGPRAALQAPSSQ